MDRCHLKGETGDRLHAVLCAAGYNIRWLLRMIAKKGVAFLQTLLLRQRSDWAPAEINISGPTKFGGLDLGAQVTGSG